MSTTVTTESLLYVIWWLKAGRAYTHAEAVAMIGGSGDWHIAPLYGERPVGTGA